MLDEVSNRNDQVARAKNSELKTGLKDLIARINHTPPIPDSLWWDEILYGAAQRKEWPLVCWLEPFGSTCRGAAAVDVALLMEHMHANVLAPRTA